MAPPVPPSHNGAQDLRQPTEGQVDHLASLYSSYSTDAFNAQYMPPVDYSQHYPLVSGQTQHHSQSLTPTSYNTVIPNNQSPAYSSDAYVPFLSSTSESIASGPSNVSSRIPSPGMQMSSDWSHAQYRLQPFSEKETEEQNDYSNQDDLADLGNFGSTVDPTLIEPTYSTPAQHNLQYGVPQSPKPTYAYSVSPSISQGSVPSSGVGPYRSEPRNMQVWQPYPVKRSQSILSDHSHHSHHSAHSNASDDKKDICPIEGCNREVRDLKSHMLTHLAERPEKCPIVSCPFHFKGFARKYDKNRHTLTHFKGTMVCDFCPGSGTANEKTFNRTDVFKRHLQSVHNVEQSAPSSRRRSGGTSTRSSTVSNDAALGKCRTCGRQFASAQTLYDHIDECALQSVQSEDPSEAINLAHLTSVANDEAVLRALEQHRLPTSLDGPVVFPDDDTTAASSPDAAAAP